MYCKSETILSAICKEKCQHGGTCVYPEFCACPQGYYGNHCEYKSGKYVIPSHYKLGAKC